MIECQNQCQICQIEWKSQTKMLEHMSDKISNGMSDEIRVLYQIENRTRKLHQHRPQIARRINNISLYTHQRHSLCSLHHLDQDFLSSGRAAAAKRRSSAT